MSRTQAWDHTKKLFKEDELKCEHLFGHTSSFETAVEVQKSLGIKSVFNTLEVKVTGLENFQEVRSRPFRAKMLKKLLDGRGV